MQYRSDIVPIAEFLSSIVIIADGLLCNQCFFSRIDYRYVDPA